DCWRESAGRLRLADANIPKRYQHCTIANFAAYNESLERAAAVAARMAATFPASTRGLVLQGQPGASKTHLAVAVLKRSALHASLPISIAGARAPGACGWPTPTFRSAISTARLRTSPPTTSRSSGQRR